MPTFYFGIVTIGWFLAITSLIGMFSMIVAREALKIHDSGRGKLKPKDENSMRLSLEVFDSSNAIEKMKLLILTGSALLSIIMFGFKE